jgi:hypothetical protein
MIQQHQPTPEYLSHLEWQVRTSLRRKDRFALPVTRNGGRRGRTIALIALSAFLGAGAVMATDQVQESRAQEVLLVRVQGQERIAALQLEMARANLDDIRKRHEEGLIGREQLIGAELPVREAETHLMTLGLDEEEIRSSGRAPQNEISAPLAGGRDFVTERFLLQVATARERLSTFEERLDWMQEAVDAGLVEPGEAEQLRAPLTEMEAEIAGMQQRIALRQRFVSGELTAGEAEAELEMMDTRVQLQRLELTHERISRELHSVEEAVDRGLVHESQLERVRFQLIQVEFEMETLQETLALLQGG